MLFIVRINKGAYGRSFNEVFNHNAFVIGLLPIKGEVLTRHYIGQHQVKAGFYRVPFNIPFPLGGIYVYPVGFNRDIKRFRNLFQPYSGRCQFG
ncbi:hypothetical protein Barb6_01337 [Bacteroidales bacterium Barb6]|nr:hypothetical protein Barb6_01337 [Bacteroidales bacterium Barb6]